MAIHQLLVREMRCEDIYFCACLCMSLFGFWIAPGSCLANQRMSSLIGLGNPSCLSITIAYTALSSKWGRNVQREGVFCWVSFQNRAAHPLFALSLYNSQILPTATLTINGAFRF